MEVTESQHRKQLKDVARRARKLIASMGDTLNTINSWNDNRQDEKPISADDHPFILNLVSGRKLLQKQLSEIERQLKTRDYGPIPTE